MTHQALVAALSNAVERSVDVPFSGVLESCGGGCISSAYALSDGSRRYFVKLNEASRLAMFEAEAEGLRLTAAANAFAVPEPIATGVFDEQAYLILDWLDLSPMTSREDGIAFGRALAHLHRHSAELYGLEGDNFIGASVQTNGRSDNWARFFAGKRLAPQFRLAAERGHRGDLQRHGERLIAKIGAFFLDYRPAISLLHGDLWGGNAAICAGRPCVFDPACYFGDREADLAMTELFGGFPLSMYAAYRETWPLDAGYELRKPLYNLYHILNHLNLFGAGYLRQAERMAAKLVAEIS